MAQTNCLSKQLHPDYKLECYGKDAGLLDDIKAHAVSINSDG